VLASIARCMHVFAVTELVLDFSRPKSSDEKQAELVLDGSWRALGLPLRVIYLLQNCRTELGWPFGWWLFRHNSREIVNPRFMP